MESPSEDEPRRVPEGAFLGVLQWHAVDGTVRRWTILQGDRANNIHVHAKGRSIACGWDRFFRGLRKRLSMPLRIWS